MATLLLTLPWFIYAQFRYGSPFPNSAAAKIGQNDLMPVDGQSPFILAIFEAWFESLPPITLVILISLFLLAIYFIARRLKRFWWLLVWPTFYALFYTSINIANFPWYFVPPIAILSMILALVFGSLLGDDQWLERPSTSILLSPSIRYGVVLVSLLILFITQAGPHPQSPG